MTEIGRKRMTTSCPMFNPAVVNHKMYSFIQRSLFADISQKVLTG